jgi:tripartite ATP-independent transporter DctM subunit
VREKAAAGLFRIGSAVEEGLCWLSLLLMVLFPLADLVLKFVFKSGFPDTAGILTHLLLVLGLVSGMITTKKKEHLSIALIENFGSEKTRRFFSALTGTFSVFVVTIIAWASVSFVRIGLMGRLIGIIPDRVFAFIIPLGYAVIALRFARLCPLKGPARIIPFLALVLGTFFSLPVIAKAVWGFEVPVFFNDLSELFHQLAWYIKIPGVIVFVLAAFAGMPLFAVMGGIALLLIEGSWGEIDVAAGQIYTALTQESIAPIPLFTITGFFLSESRAGERLVRAFRSVFGWFPGGMIIVTVGICAFFTSFTGASGVTILALGGLLYTILRDHMKYPERFSIGLLTSSGSIGLLIPPSLPIILVGTATMTNIRQLFAGAIIPGTILVTALIAFGIVMSVKTRVPTEPFRVEGVLKNLRDSAFEIALPLLIMAGVLSGLLSITELGAAALAYVFILEVFVNRDIALRDIPGVLRKAAPIIGGVLSIIALAMALSYYIIDSQVPQNFAYWLRSAVESKFVFLLLLNLSLLVVGCLMDIFSAILIVLPLVSPLGAAYGIDPVHLGIIFLTNLEVGYLTPPVGLNLFLASYRFNKPFTRICRYVLPFLLLQFAVVLLVTYVPALSTFLAGFF